MSEFENEGQSVQSSGLTSDSTQRKIGGALYLVAFSIFIAPLFSIIQLYSNHIVTISDGSWSKLTSKASESYHPMYLPTLTMELLGTLFLFAFQILLLRAFLKKSKEFTYLFKYYLLSSTLLSLFIYLCVYSYPYPDKAVLYTLLKDFIKSIFVCAIWISYFSMSVRVKETFTGDNNFFEKRKARVILAISMAPFFFLFSTAILLKDSKPGPAVVKNSELDPKKIAESSLDNLVVIEPLDENGNPTGVGSGFFILPDLIVTNHHVIEEGDTFRVRFTHSKIPDYISEIVAYDSVTDIALVRAKNLRSKSPLSLEGIESLVVGDKVYAAGNPNGLEGTFSNGLLSNKLSSKGLDYLQISAPISPGSSGGPVLNTFGKVIGVATSVFKEGQNLNIAVPSPYIARLIMKSKTFRPVESNSELKLNPSIGMMFPKVCNYLVDVTLSDKYFTELSDRDLKETGLNKVCDVAMPSCKKVWYNKSTGATLYVGSTSLRESEASSLRVFESEMEKFISNTKQGYLKTNPETVFNVQKAFVGETNLKYDLKASYVESGENTTDHRSLFFVLPYCRIDFLYVSTEKNKELDESIFKVLGDSFVPNLPGAKTEKVFYKNSK